MAYEIKPNSGSLFKVKPEDRPSDKHPEYSGTINVDGKEYWLSGWVNEAKSGQKYFSLKVKPKDAPKDAKPDPARHFDDMKDQIPF